MKDPEIEIDKIISMVNDFKMQESNKLDLYIPKKNIPNINISNINESITNNITPPPILKSNVNRQKPKFQMSFS